MRRQHGRSNLQFHFDARAESVDDRKQAIKREAIKVCIADTGEICGRYAGTLLRGAHGQLFLVQRLDDFGGQQGIELLQIGVSFVKVAVDVAATTMTLIASPFISASPSTV